MGDAYEQMKRLRTDRDRAAASAASASASAKSEGDAQASRRNRAVARMTDELLRILRAERIQPFPNYRENRRWLDATNTKRFAYDQVDLWMFVSPPDARSNGMYIGTNGQTYIVKRSVGPSPKVKGLSRGPGFVAVPCEFPNGCAIGTGKTDKTILFWEEMTESQLAQFYLQVVDSARADRASKGH